jgi:hypothetical protein
MITIYIVFYESRMCFAFETIHQAEEYIKQAVIREPGIYTRQNLYWRSVDTWFTYPN